MSAAQLVSTGSSLRSPTHTARATPGLPAAQPTRTGTPP
jgi:hypothetical protein